MINYELAELIRIQRKQLRQEKETYEDCCKKYRKEVENEYNEFYGKFQELNYWGEGTYEMKDTQLSNLIEDNRELLNTSEEVCGKLLMTIDDELKRYLCEYEAKDDALYREQQRLELMI